jgi:NAD(P)-dependent dehydrogenase (short-subunit alcohol dehydrogenase family)
MSAPIIVLGAHGGLGAALARRLADRGHPLFLTARDKESISDLADELDARTASLDVVDTDALSKVIASADEGEGIAGLAYCVGNIVLKPLESASAEGLTRALAGGAGTRCSRQRHHAEQHGDGIARKLLSSGQVAKGLGAMHPAGRYGQPDVAIFEAQWS